VIDGKALYIEEMWEYIPGDHDVVSEELDKCMLVWLITKQVQEIFPEDQESRDKLVDKLAEPEGYYELMEVVEKMQNTAFP